MHFIEAKSPGAHVFSAFKIPRLGAVLLATMASRRGYGSRAYIEDVARPDWKELESADIIGISAITPTALRAYALGDRFRAMGKTVVMGGPHPTFMAEEALAHSDYVVRGEGEDTLDELLDALESGGGLEGVRGLSFNTPAGPVHNPDRGLIADLDAYPSPDFSLVHGWRDKRIVPILTSRGCPFNCRFCSVIQMFGRRYRNKSVGRVISELRQSAPKGSHVFFVDDNFTADKDRAKALLRRMMDEKLKVSWSAQVRTDAARDPELLGVMKRSGCTSVYVGFESFNPETLRHFNKKQDIGDIENSVRAFRAHRIRMHGMFVFGSDTDDIETIRSTPGIAGRMGVDSVQFMMLTPLPGTPVYDEMKAGDRLIHTAWNKYDAHHAVFRPAKMSPSELQRETFRAMASFYSWQKIIRHMARLDVAYGIRSIYGKFSVKKALAEGERYLTEIGASLMGPEMGLKR